MATINGMSDTVSEMGRQAAEQGYDAAREYAAKGADAVRDYAEKGADMLTDVSGNLRDFVSREPWVALVAAFAVGYLVARALRRVPA
jgi:hypothetical protein